MHVSAWILPIKGLLILLLSQLGNGRRLPLRKRIVDNYSKYIQLQLYYGPYPGNYTNIPYNEGLSLTNYSSFNTSYKTIFYFPGWGEYPRTGGIWQSLVSLIPAFRSLKNTNLIVFDFWDLIQFSSYPQAVQNSTVIGVALAEYFAKFIPAVQPKEMIHLIGHSLGCQIISNTARSYMALGYPKFPRITGLDPARPGYTTTHNHLRASDGEYVDIIHTNDGGLGLAGYGTINFYVNGGSVQPYCFSAAWQLGCAHFMSWRIYTESIYNSIGFVAKQCNDMCDVMFPFCSCNSSNLAYIGYNVDTSKTGNYFLKTNDKPPFAMGLKGITFDKF